MEEIRETVIHFDESLSQNLLKIVLAAIQPVENVRGKALLNIIGGHVAAVSVKNPEQENVRFNLADEQAVLVRRSAADEARRSDGLERDLRNEFSAFDALLDVDAHVEPVVPRAERVEVDARRLLALVLRVAQVADRVGAATGRQSERGSAAASAGPTGL